MNEDSALSFPCDIPIKVFGPSEGNFRDTALAIVRAHYGELPQDRISERQSSGGSYLSLTITVHAESRVEIDALYLELTGCEQILMVL